MTVSDLLFTSPALLISLAVLAGLLVGSFLNVVVYRLPLMMQQEWHQQSREFLQLDKSIAAPAGPLSEHAVFNLSKPDSHCPHCRKPVRFWENIPLLSYLLLRGRCSGCNERISARYPLTELLSALLAGLIAWEFGADWTTVFLLAFTWSLITLTLIDLDHQLLPDLITLPLLWLGLLLAVLDIGWRVTPSDAILGAVAGYLLLWSVYWIFKLLTGKEGMGYGDFKLLAALGAWLGWQHLALIVILSSLVGAVTGVALMLLLGRDRNIPIPFGPFLASAGFVTLLWGEALIQLYLNFLVYR